MSTDFINIEFEEGDDYLPSRLKVIFSKVPWNMAFKLDMHASPYFTKEESRKREARQAIKSFLYMLEKELTAALPEHLK